MNPNFTEIKKSEKLIQLEMKFLCHHMRIRPPKVGTEEYEHYFMLLENNALSTLKKYYRP